MNGRKFKLAEPSTTERGPFQASKQDYEATRRRKALCLKNFMRIVERFGRNPVTEEMVAVALPWLEREQFDDIPVERFAYKNCGYVLCKKSIPKNQLNQKYRISVARRRVYEVGDRKYFCSDWCYRASCYLRHQIPSDPVWCRSLPTGPMPNLKFLPANAPGRPGKTILNALANLRLIADIENTKSQSSSSEDEDEGYDLKKENSDTEDTSSESSYSSDEHAHWNEVIPQAHKAKIIERKSKTFKKPPLKVEEESKNVSAAVNIKSNILPKKEMRAEQGMELDPKEVVLNRLNEWITKESVEVLYSEESPTSKDRAKNPSSEYGAKVRTFLSDYEATENGSNIVLPFVDSVSQGSLRLQILMESLSPSLKNVLFRMKIPPSRIYDKLRNVIAHFHLTNKNLHVRPKELKLMCCSLLHLLTAKDDQLILHRELVELLSASFDGDETKVEAYLNSVMEIADKFHEASLEMPS
nr:hypothetical protein HmN_000373250 [Hymenolepis microstoma]